MQVQKVNQFNTSSYTKRNNSQPLEPKGNNNNFSFPKGLQVQHFGVYFKSVDPRLAKELEKL